MARKISRQGTALPRVTEMGTTTFRLPGHLAGRADALVRAGQFDRVADLIDLSISTGLILGLKIPLENARPVLADPALIPNHFIYGLVISEIMNGKANDRMVHGRMEEFAAGGLELILNEYVVRVKRPGDGLVDGDILGGFHDSGVAVTYLKLERLLARLSGERT